MLISFYFIGHWLPQAYLFYNLIFVFCLLWSVHQPLSVDAVHFAAVLDFASFFFDLLCIILGNSYGKSWMLYVLFVSTHFSSPFRHLFTRFCDRQSCCTALFPDTPQSRTHRSRRELPPDYKSGATDLRRH